MKHDRLRRLDRGPADPSVIHPPGPLQSRRSCGSELEAGGVTIPQDKIEALAPRTDLDVAPRASRQVQRKTLRAEKKAARQAATERFLAGAPSMAEAARQFDDVAPVHDGIEQAPQPTREHEAAVALLADLLVGERPVPEVLVEAHFSENCDHVEILEGGAAKPRSIETTAAMVSLSGPLIVEIIRPQAEVTGKDPVPPSTDRFPVATDVSAPVLVEAVAAASPVMEPSADMAFEMEMAEPSWLEAVAETPITPLPRNRALVAHKRHWLARLVPWLARRRAPAPEPVMTQLQDLRVELVTALRKLDRIIDQTG